MSTRTIVFGAGAAAVVAAALAFVFWPESEAAGTPGSFYLEAVILVDDSWAINVGTNIADGDAEPPPGAQAVTSETVLRQWFEPPDLWRWETETVSEFHGDQSWVGVSDGSEVVFFQPNENTFSRVGYGPIPGWEGLPWLPSAMLIGRVPGVDAAGFVATLDALYEGRLTLSQHPDALNGIPVVLIETSPVSCSAKGSMSEGESVVVDENCSGRSLMWLDESRMLIVRNESWVDDETRISVAEVTDYRTDIRHDPGLFEFRPPEGAVDVTESRDGPTGASSGSATSDR